MPSRTRAACLAWGLALACAAAAARPVALAGAQCVVSASPAPPAHSAAWQACPLPDRWSATGRQAAGSVWYRLVLPAAAPGAAPPSLWLPLLSMNAELWLQGQRLAATTDGAGGRTTRHWNHPWLVALPQAPPPAALLHVRVQASAINEGLLAAPWLGEAHALRERHARTLLWRVVLPGWGLAFGLSLGLVFLLIRLHDARQQAWGYFGAGAVLWSLGTLNLTLVHLPGPDALWETAVHVTQFAGLLCLVMFGLAFAQVLGARRRRGLLLYGAGAIVLMPWTALRGTGQLMMLLMLPLLLAGGHALWAIVRHTRGQRLASPWALAAAALLTLLAAGHDWAARVGWLPLERPFMLPLAAPVLLAALAWMLAQAHARLHADLGRANEALEHRLREREAALALTHAQQARVQSELAVVQERARILRDMHDGAGAHLSTAIRMVDAAAPSNAALAQTLRDALDQLKLSIDALNLPPGDVVALLASVRYRLAPRLEQAGIALTWDVHDLPTWPMGRHDRAMQHLLFIVFEIVSNVLQHARATQLCVRAECKAGRIELAFADNGRGMADGSEPALKTLRARARLIGAGVELDQAQPGLTLRLALPLASPPGAGQTMTGH